MSFHSRIYRFLMTGLSLGSRIYLAAGTTLVCVALFLLYTVLTQKQLTTRLHEILDVRIIAMNSAEQVQQSIVAHDDMLFRYLATGNTSLQQEMRRLHSTTRREITLLSRLSNSQVIRSRLHQLEIESNHYFDDVQNLLDFASLNKLPNNAGVFTAAAWARSQEAHRKELFLLSTEGLSRLVRVFSLCEELVTLNRAELERARHEMDEALEQSRRAAWVSGGIAAGVILLVAFGLAFSLLGPLGALMEGVHRVEKGDLSLEIPVTSFDELGQLTKSFNQMTRTVNQQREQLLREAITDPLTGAYNQRYFRHLLKQELERSRRSDQPLALLMIDIDHFKHYNDTLGHEKGNDVLKRVCTIIQENLREIDTLTRYGGDELAVLLPRTSVEEVRIITERMVESLSHSHFMGEEQLPSRRLTLSIGGAAFPDDAQSAQDLVLRADEALYAAKQSGRDCVKWAAENKIDSPRS